MRVKFVTLSIIATAPVSLGPFSSRLNVFCQKPKRMPYLPYLRNVVYEFACDCNAWYAGRTSQRRADRMRQRLSLVMRKCTGRCNDHCQPKRRCKAGPAKQEGDSAIGTHLLKSKKYGSMYSEDCFRMLSTARSAFNLKVLERCLSNFEILPSIDRRSFLGAKGFDLEGCCLSSTTPWLEGSCYVLLDFSLFVWC